MANPQKHVLLVEDEPLVRLVLEDVLGEAGGFRVTAVADAETALKALRDGAEFDLLLSDQNLPGALEGTDLLCEVGARWPGIALVLMSGLGPGGALPAGARFLQKPVACDDLLRVLGSVLAEKAAKGSSRRFPEGQGGPDPGSKPMR